MLYSREELESFSTKKLLDLKNKWNFFLKISDETDYGDSKFLKQEARRNIALIRDVISNKEAYNE